MTTEHKPERWTASRFTETTRGGYRIDVTNDVIALDKEADSLRAEVERLREAGTAVDRAWGAWINHEEGEGFDAVVDAIGNLRATLEGGST